MEQKPMSRDEKARAELQKKNMDKQLEQMKKAKCMWPGCKKKQMMHVSIQLVEPQPDGTMKPVGADPKNPADGGVGVTIPMCDFHFHFARFCAAIKQEGDKIGLLAPVDIVEVARTAVYAMHFSGEMKQIDKAMQQAEKDRIKFEQELEKKKNENQAKDAEQKADKPSDNKEDDWDSKDVGYRTVTKEMPNNEQ